MATPIGNLDDMSTRARDCLKQADFIAAEDTRVTKTLLRRLEIPPAKLISCHEHNESQRINMILNRLRSGASVVLVSDAGTPLMNDPGYQLVAAAIAEHIVVQCIPGPNAAVTALMVAGLPTDRFLVCGYLPRARSARLTAIQALRKEQATLLLYESPHRILSLLDDLLQDWGERKAALARNLTKEDEHVYRGLLSEIAEELRDQDRIWGELTLVVDRAPPERQTASDELIDCLIERLLREGLLVRSVRNIVCDVFHLAKRDAYERVLQESKKQSASKEVTDAEQGEHEA